MPLTEITYHGEIKEGRAVKLVFVDGNIVCVCIAEINERGHSKGLPTLKISGPDDKKTMALAYSFRSFTPVITEAEFNEIAETVARRIIDFRCELPLKDGLSQTNLV